MTIVAPLTNTALVENVRNQSAVVTRTAQEIVTVATKAQNRTASALKTALENIVLQLPTAVVQGKLAAPTKDVR